MSRQRSSYFLVLNHDMPTKMTVSTRILHGTASTPKHVTSRQRTIMILYRFFHNIDSVEIYHKIFIILEYYNRKRVAAFSSNLDLVSNEERDIINIKLQRYNKMNGIIKCYIGNHMTTDTKSGLYNITSKVGLCYGSENWIIIKKRRPETGSCTDEILETIIRPYKTGPLEKL